MTKEQKIQLVQELTEQFKEYPNFYIADSGGMSVAEMNELRGLCHKSDIKLQMVKNTLIRKALENLEGDYSEVYDSLKMTSSVFFASAENPSIPAKVLKEFRKKNERPVLKAAVIETSVFKGDDQIKALAELKSKDELIGEIVGLLQSPAKNVISALKSGGGTIAGILKTLSEREEAA
ncbi:MAG: 50S ribosomal protein L10 [Bacteroidota bacterium]